MKYPTIAVITLAIMLGIGLGGSSLPRERSKYDDLPCAMVMYTPGNGPPDSPCGLIMAVWRDGTMLFSAGECSPGKHMLVGQADIADVDAMVEAMIRAGFFGKLKDDSGVPDAGFSTMALRVRTSKARRHSGSLIPGFGKNANPDADYWAYVKMWRRCEAELHAISPHKVERLEDRLEADGTFRGYNPDEPFETPWLHGDAWR